MKNIAFLALSVVLGGLLGGCATAALSGNIGGAPARCMRPPEAIAPLKAGDDLLEKHAALRLALKRSNSKTRCLQKYARTVSTAS